MAKYLGIILGTIFLLGGIFLVWQWQSEVLFILKGSLPWLFILAGAIALYAGVAEVIDTIKFEKEDKKS